MQGSLVKLDARSAHRQRWTRWLQQVVSVADRPLVAAALAGLVYAALAAHRGSLLRVTRYPYFNYLADAFLHGQLSLRLTPSFTRDLSLFDGNLYLYWPPMPAVLLMPFVAIWGVQLSDVLVTVVLGAVNVGLVTLLLRHAHRRGIAPLEPWRRGLLVLFFAFGTVHMTLPPYGMVWFVGQLVGFGFVALAYLATLSLRGAAAFGLAGLALAGALTTRNHLALTGLWPAVYLLISHRDMGWRRLLGWSLLGVAPAVAAVGLLGLYNALRFGSPLDNGLAYHDMADIFARDYQRYGAFDLHFLRANVEWQLLRYPFPLTPRSLMGGSLLLLSPLFFAAFWGLRSSVMRWSAWALAATVALTAVPILLLMGTGWVQWGPRYTLDYTVPLLLLTALGIRRLPGWLVSLLVGVSIAHYLIGALFLSRFVA